MDCVYVVRIKLDSTGVKTNFATFAELSVYEENNIIDRSAVESLEGSKLGAFEFVYRRLRSAGYHVMLIHIHNPPMKLLKLLRQDDPLRLT